MDNLTGDERALLAALVTREIWRQSESEKMDLNKRNPDYDSARSARRLVVRLQAILRKINATAPTAETAATPVAATPTAKRPHQ